MSLGDSEYKLPAAIVAGDGGDGTSSGISISESAAMATLSAASAGLPERRWKSSDLDGSRHSLRHRE